MNALVLLIASLLFVSSVALWLWTRKRMQEFSLQIHQQIYSEQVIDQISAINAGSIGMGDRFLKLEREMQMLSARLDDLQAQMHSNTPYAHAITLAQKGSSAEEIMELCGISLNEAELLLMMHRHGQAA
jgi:hypothetical protein